MIELSSSLLRQIRSLFRRVVGRATRGQAGPLVVFEAQTDQLMIRACGTEAAIEYRLPGAFEPIQFAIPLATLAECEGRKSSAVRFEAPGDNRLRLSWRDGAVPRTKEIGTTKLPSQAFPPASDSLQAAGPGLLAALDAAAETTDRESSRYALGCIQLRGRSGQIVATDGRQLLVQSDFGFPWTDDVLVPGLTVFGNRELPRDVPVQIGRSEKHVTLVIGPWSIHLTINREGRFPRVDDVVPAGFSAASLLRLHPADARFLLDTIDRLPGDEILNHPITLDLNGQVIVRARSEEEPRPTEVILTNSRLEGDPLRLHSNREYLARAVHLGFSEFSLFGNAKPVLAQDANRRYVWVGLDAEGAVPPAEDAVRIESPQEANYSSIRNNPIKELNVTQSIPMASDAPTASTKPQQRLRAAATKSPVKQAVALRNALQTAARQANELARTLKRHKRQSRLVETTLASLKQLQAAS